MFINTNVQFKYNYNLSLNQKEGFSPIYLGVYIAVPSNKKLDL